MLLTIVFVHEGLVPKGADVDTQHLGGLDHLAQAPHQRSVHAHQLLAVHLIGFVQNATGGKKKTNKLGGQLNRLWRATHRILSSLPLRLSIALRNSSDMSSL